MESLAFFILGAWWKAVLTATFFGLLGLYVLPFTLASGGAIALWTLRYGLRSGLVVALVAAGLVLAGAQVLPPRPGFPFPPALALYPPLLLMAELLRWTASQGMALTALAIYLMFYLLWIHWWTGDVVQFWDDWLKEAIRNVEGATLKGFYVEGTIRLFNGLVAFIYGVSTFVSLLLACWWRSLLFHPGEFKAEFLELRLPPLLLALFVGLMWFCGAALENRLLMSDLLIVGMGIYLFQGLAVLHGMQQQLRLRWYFLLPIYFGFWVMPPYVITGLALVGAIDAFVDFRRRFGEREEP